LITASQSENQDLFWAIRGGGGNFGIATSFRFRLHPVDAVLAGSAVHPVAKAKDLLRFFRQYVSDMPEELTLFVGFRTARESGVLPKDLHGTVIATASPIYIGSIPAGESALAPLRSFGPPVVDRVRPMTYLDLQSDPSWLPGFGNYWASAYLRNLSDSAIDTIISHAATMTSRETAFAVCSLGGCIGRVGDTDTAYAHRNARFGLFIYTRWSDLAESQKHIEWTRKFCEAMRPFRSGPYPNLLMDEGEEEIRAAYGPNFGRLIEVKRKYDPSNLFRSNQNIRPST